MMNETLRPNSDEVFKWLRCTLQHSCHVEYYLGRLNVGKEDHQRPHDLVGSGNKLEWDVIKGFALQFRNRPPDFDTYILPALKRHRVQHHHQMWNEPDPNDRRRHNRDATPDALKLGAIDAICSLREPRGYQGGAHTFEEIEQIIDASEDAHKRPWLKLVLPEMAALPVPQLELITSLERFPNIGLPDVVYRAMQRRMEKVSHEMFRLGYILID